MSNLRLANWYWIQLLVLMLLIMSRSASASALGEDFVKLAWLASDRSMTIDQALEHLSKSLNAQIIILEKLEQKQVVLNMAKRSPMDSLKSILKGYSYALVYGEPVKSCRIIDYASSPPDSSHILDTGITPTDKATETAAVVREQDRLAVRIERLEAQIESGEADRFFERWRRVKDPKYIYNHRQDVKRFHKRMTALNSPTALNDGVHSH